VRLPLAFVGGSGGDGARDGDDRQREV
jgi:hypothetical protein